MLRCLFFVSLESSNAKQEKSSHSTYEKQPKVGPSMQLARLDFLEESVMQGRTWCCGDWIFIYVGFGFIFINSGRLRYFSYVLGEFLVHMFVKWFVLMWCLMIPCDVFLLLKGTFLICQWMK